MTFIPSRPSRRHRAPSWLALLALLAGGASSVQAQSIGAGRVTGTVRDTTGDLVYDASISLVNPTSGVAREVVTRRDGRFDFTLLQPGEYDLLVQRFGYQPRRLLRVPVRARAAVAFDIRLTPAGPELGVDSMPFPGAPAGGATVSLQRGDASFDFAEIIDPRGWLTPPALMLPGGDGLLGSAGLPGRMSASAVDGMLRWSPRHPRVAGAELDGVAFPLLALRGMELLPGGIDAEWPGTGGGILSAYTTGGPRRTQGTVSLAGGSDGFTGAFEFGGALVPDTAHFALGVVAGRLTPALPEAWSDTSAATAAAVAIARDSFQTDLAPYRDTRHPVQTSVAAFGRFDGIIGSNHTVSVRVAGATATLEEAPLGLRVAPVLEAQVKTRDLSGGATLTSILGPSWGSELRLSAEAGDRDYADAGLVGTLFTDGGFSAGTSGLQPATVKRSTLRASETVHWRALETVNVKAGLSAGISSHDITFADHRQGRFTFGDTTGLASRSGAFRQTVGSLPSARFSIINIGAYGQLAYRPIPGFEVLAGVRWDVEDWPTEDILLNVDWVRSAGIDNRPGRGARYFIAPRVAFTWSFGPDAGWQVRGEAGMFADPLDPGVLGEAITHARGVTARRGFGVLGAWPNVPDSVAAPVTGQTLSMLGEDFNAPRTGRTVFGIAGNLGGGLVLRFDGDYRHTDFLPLRRDLNLAVSPGGRDQFGRTLYGTLVKSGTLLAAQPGTNRRFDTFDEVSTLDPAASSDHIGLTLALEKMVGRFAFNAAYTYSRTQDNWFGARGDGSEAQFVPLADSTGRSRWARARSDFDVPHRLLLGTELRLGSRQGVRLAVLYRLQSGYPFTPGFRDGVDANGDGSARNDPAFLSDTVAGASDVFGRNSCLRQGTGDFAERNSCRDPMITSLDMRLAAVVARIRGRPAELMVDAFGLLRTGMDQYDHALYLVDGAAPLVTNPATRVTSVPLVANPNFGERLIKRAPTASVRAGLRVAF